MSKYYLIYKTNKLHVKSFKEFDDMYYFLFKLKLENKYYDKFKYKVVYGHELSYIPDSDEKVGFYDFCSELFGWENN